MFLGVISSHTFLSIPRKLIIMLFTLAVLTLCNMNRVFNNKLWSCNKYWKKRLLKQEL